jgi:hypothetical protein
MGSVWSDNMRERVVEGSLLSKIQSTPFLSDESHIRMVQTFDTILDLMSI